MSGNGLRRPTDLEQAIIAAVHDARMHAESKRINVVGIGMGPKRIEDQDGRWTRLLGLPVVEVATTDPKAVVLFIDVPLLDRTEEQAT